jgi:arginyl-tRNA synthetase
MLYGQEEIAQALRAALGARGFADAEPQLMPIEPPREWGVTTNVCFTLAGRAAAEEIAKQAEGLPKAEAKQLAGRLGKEAGERLAQEIALDLAGRTAASAKDSSLPFVAKIEAEGAYINFYYDAEALSEHVVAEVLRLGADYGKGAPTQKRIMVEYAQPNTHKDFHVGHLRNAAIGQAIANLLEFAGHSVRRATYIGDIGLHVARAIWGEEQFLENPAASRESFFSLPKAEAGEGLEYWGWLYQEATRYLARLEAEHKQQAAAGGEGRSPYQTANLAIRTWLADWEDHVQEAREEWRKSREECVLSFLRIFDELLVRFDEDCWFFESAVEDTGLGRKGADQLRLLGVAQLDDSAEYKGALYVDFEQHLGKFPESERKRIRRLGKMTILRSDGTSLYQTKELGLAKHKFERFSLDESLYVVGAEQKLYFEQVFAILHLWGFPNADNCKHISYELVVLPEGKMRSREGNVVSYRELRDEAIRRAEAITREKGIAGDVEQVARDVAIAAIKYAMLQVTGSQKIVFDFEQALSFDGRAAPYLQYAYARTRTLVGGLEDLAGPSALMPKEADTAVRPTGEFHPSEVALARTLSTFPATCADAAAHYEPATLCTYLYSLASQFAEFYRDCRVLDAPEPMRTIRRRLSAAFRQVMQSGFGILALPLPEEM